MTPQVHLGLEAAGLTAAVVGAFRAWGNTMIIGPFRGSGGRLRRLAFMALAREVGWGPTGRRRWPVLRRRRDGYGF